MAKEVATVTEREREVLRLLLCGHDAKSIASQIGSSVHAVNERLRSARRKLGVSSSREAARVLNSHENATNHPENFGDKEFGLGASIPRQSDTTMLSGDVGDRRPSARLAVGGVMTVLIIAGTALALVNSAPQPAAPDFSDPAGGSRYQLATAGSQSGRLPSAGAEKPGDRQVVAKCMSGSRHASAFSGQRCYCNAAGCGTVDID